MLHAPPACVAARNLADESNQQRHTLKASLKTAPYLVCISFCLLICFQTRAIITCVVGCHVDEVKDLRHLPENAYGLFVLAGNHRSVALVCSFFVSDRRELCVELIQEARRNGEEW